MATSRSRTLSAESALPQRLLGQPQKRGGVQFFDLGQQAIERRPGRCQRHLLLEDDAYERRKPRLAAPQRGHPKALGNAGEVPVFAAQRGDAVAKGFFVERIESHLAPPFIAGAGCEAGSTAVREVGTSADILGVPGRQ